MSNGNDKTRAIVAALALAGLATVSCVKEPGGSAPGGGDNSGVTATDPGSGANAPSPSAVPRAPAHLLPVQRVTRVQRLPGGSVETPTSQPTAAVLEAVNAAQGKLNGVASSVEGAKVRFVDCNEAASCTTRLEAKTLTGLRDLLQAVSKDQGGITYVAREQLDAYTGQSFVADVTLGGATTRPVPSNENELIANNDVP